MEPTLAEATFLAAIAFLAGALDAIAGGGGLVTLPALLSVGLPADLALGTNKGQAVFGSSAALARFWHAGLVDARRALPSFLLGLAGSSAGVATVLLLDPTLLRPVVIVLLFCVTLFMALRRDVRPRERQLSPNAAAIAGAVVALVVGFYDGFFGPGTGTFLIVAYVSLLGMRMKEASANAKVVNFASNLAAVVLFASRGKIVVAYALPMALAQMAGGFFGAHMAVRVGDTLVRRTVMLVAVALMLKVAWDLWSA